MRKLEAFFGFVVAIGFFGTVLVAITNLGSLVYKARSETPPRVAAVISTGNVTEPTAPKTAEAGAGEAAPAVQLAAADTGAGGVVSVDAGEKVFKKCKACHVTAPDGAH